METVENRNGVNIKDYLNDFSLDKNKDYVRLRNLVISGKVWQDNNGNGLKNTNEPGINGIEVRLIDITNKKYIKTKTNTDGEYSFGKKNAKGYLINNYSSSNGRITYTETTTEDTKLMCDSKGRVIKATNRDDSTGNYDETSRHIQYVIEFSYNGMKYYTTTYAGRDNISDSDLSINNDYKIDSNAKESNVGRQELYDTFDTVYYNNGVDKDGNITALRYTKNGHVSTLKDTNSLLKAYSFSNGTSITPLWLKTSPGNSVLGESEYLKHINLGLISKSADLEISNDVAEVKTYINGEETTYTFNQGDVAGSEYSGAYRTGGESVDKFYQLNIYTSDYYYQSSDYKDSAIKTYKNSTELQIQVKYKITIYNKTNYNNQSYARIKEIVDYYGKQFLTTLDKKTEVKIYNADGDLEKVLLNNFEVSNNYSYSKTKIYANRISSHPNYNRVYIQSPIDIAEGGKAEFYLTYTIGKADNTLSSGDIVKLLKIDDNVISNIVEISAYSIYAKNTETPVGLIDIDSNPGNLGKDETVSEYEDDTYETRLKIDKTGNNRTISGYVWDDARGKIVQNNDGIQYIGNGEYGSATEDYKKGAAYSLRNTYSSDKKIPGVTAHLVEEVRIKQSDGSYKLYEYDWSDSQSKAYKELSGENNQKYISTSNDDGEYILSTFIPGVYKVKFYYGCENDKNEIGDNQLKYNGQDYKSTQYKGVVQDVDGINKLFAYNENQTNDDLGKMVEENQNDALDDELRRLETIAYSEIQTNKIQNVINQSNINNSTTASMIKSNKEEFVNNMYMHAETAFMRLNTELTKNSNNKYYLNKKSYTFVEVQQLSTAESSYSVNNIDFGIEYRPKTAISLNKYIKRFKVVLSDNKTLADVKFNEIYDGETHALIGTIVNRNESIGMDNTLLVETSESNVGAISLAVDPELLQGATVSIDYIFAIKNEGEVDRIAFNLDNLRFSYDDVINSNERNALINETISAIAYKRLKDIYSQTLGYDNPDTIEHECTTSNLGNNKNTFKYRLLYNANNDSGYYGKYLGSTYYTGTINNDVVAKTMINTIVDYVPTGLGLDQNSNIGKNGYWGTISATELADKYVQSSVLTDGNVYDYLNRAYYDKTSGKSNIAISANETIYSNIGNIQNESLTRFLVPIKADKYTLNNNDGTTMSSGIIKINASTTITSKSDIDDLRFVNCAEIVQITTQTGRCTPTNRDAMGTSSNYQIPLSKSITLPDGLDENEYQNLEVKRELVSTLGNYNPKYIYEIASESDDDFVDPIILLPPTGIIPFYIKESGKKIITITVVAIVVVLIILGKNKKIPIRKALKRKKIKISFKKYYK